MVAQSTIILGTKCIELLFDGKLTYFTGVVAPWLTTGWCNVLFRRNDVELGFTPKKD